uniref:Putative secreted protein n=1 Tax=Ixodes ricinus TaxID=34613 RepID=A0A6B0UT59_IXORI
MSLALHGFFFFFFSRLECFKITLLGATNAGRVSTCGSLEPRLPLAPCRFDRNRQCLCSREKNVRGGPDELKAEGKKIAQGAAQRLLSTLLFRLSASSAASRVETKENALADSFRSPFPCYPFPEAAACVVRPSTVAVWSK